MADAVSRAAQKSNSSLTNKTINNPNKTVAQMATAGSGNQGKLSSSYGSSNKHSSASLSQYLGINPQTGKAYKNESEKQAVEAQSKWIGPSAIKKTYGDPSSDVQVNPTFGQGILAGFAQDPSGKGLINAISNSFLSSFKAGASIPIGGSSDSPRNALINMGPLSFSAPLVSPAKSDRQDSLLGTPAAAQKIGDDGSLMRSDSDGAFSGISSLSSPAGNQGNAGSLYKSTVSDSAANVDSGTLSGSNHETGANKNAALTSLGASFYNLNGNKTREIDMSKAATYKELYEDLGKGTIYDSLLGANTDKLGIIEPTGAPGWAWRNAKKYLGQ